MNLAPSQKLLQSIIRRQAAQWVYRTWEFPCSEMCLLWCFRELSRHNDRP